MIREIECAVNFLTRLIRDRTMVINDENYLIYPQPFPPNYLTTANLADFVHHLTHILHERYTNVWFPENPTRGQAFRCIRLNSNFPVEPSLKAAADASEIEYEALNLNRLELTIWIDPRMVSGRYGENDWLSILSNVDEKMIKQEFDDEDVDGQEIDDDNDPKCENCEKGICKSVCEKYDIVSGDIGGNGDEFLETQQNVDLAFEGNQMNQSIVSNDILSNPTNQINTESQINQQCLKSLSITIHNRNAAPNDLLLNEPIEGQNSPIDEFDDNDDDDDDDDDDYYEDSENEHLNNPNCEDCVNGVCDLDHENNNNQLNNHKPFETQNVDFAQEDNQFKQSIISNDIDETSKNANNELQVNVESDQLHNVCRSNEQNSKKKTSLLIKRRTRQSEEPIESPTPFTSGVRLSTRKRIQKKVFGYDQLNDGDDKKPKSKKLKSVQSNNISVKYHKQIKIENADEDDIVDDDEDSHDNQEEVKAQVNVLKFHCTEPGCSQTVTSRSSWREHIRNDHHKRPHHQLNNNARLNDRDHTEYICIEPTCNAICTTYSWLSIHWNHYHQPGEFKCSLCPFVANLHYKVRNHFNNTHASHECIHCGEKFSKMSDLKRHERVHTGERPYKCTWKKCTISFKEIGNAVKHVRAKHFNLPKTTKEQNELNIIDSRNARDYIHKILHLPLSF